MAKKLSKIEIRVESLLAEYETLRNNDRRLIRRYLLRYHDIKTFNEYVKDENAPALETITRCRRLLQAEGKYPAKESVAKERQNEESEHRRHMGR
jgi:hypothetical protein